MPFIKQFEIGPMQNFCYLIGDPKTKDAVIVDPAWDASKILAVVETEGFKLSGLVVTHAHYDHSNAIPDLLKIKDVPVYANKEEAKFAKTPSSLVGNLGSTLKTVEGEEVLKVGTITLKFLHTPGHTPGSQCILVDDVLLTGDTLFIGGCGRSDLTGGDPATLFKSLQKIAKLPASLRIFPGHDYGDTPTQSLEEEIKENRYLQIKDEEIFINAVSY